MKQNMKKGAVLLLSLILCLLTAGQVSAENTAVVAAEDNGFTEITWEYTGFLYRDEMLFTDALQLSTDLAKASVSLAAAAYNKEAVQRMLTADPGTDPEFSGMGFTFVSDGGSGQNTGDGSYEWPRTLNDNDMVAYTIGRKEVDGYVLYCIPIRGTGENAEWFSDFNLGVENVYSNTKEHKGFKIAADRVYLDMQHAFETDGYDDAHRIVWLTGHSRGASVANILADKINNTGYAYPGHMFCYTFACPSVGTPRKEWNNIYNYNIAGDIIPVLPLTEWGYGRNARNSDDNQGAQGVYKTGYINGDGNIAQRYQAITGENLTLFSTTEHVEQMLSGLFLKESEYYELFRQLVVAQIAWNLGGHNCDATWQEVVQYIAGHYEESIVKPVWNTIISWNNPRDLLTGLTQKASYLEDLAQSCDAVIEHFTKYVNEVFQIDGDLKNTLFYETGVLVESLADLYKALVPIRDGINDAIAYADLIQGTVDALFDVNGNLLGAVGCGHRPETYCAWIYSMYFGYRGWAGGDPGLIYRPELSAPEITTIGTQCFDGCSPLGTLTLSPRLQAVGGYAFFQAGISGTLTLPEGTEWLGNNAFERAGDFEILELPHSVSHIGQYAFGCCDGIREVTLPIEQSLGNIFSFENGSRTESIHYLKGSTGIMPDRRINAGMDSEDADCTEWDATLEYFALSTLREIDFEEGIVHIGDRAYEAPYNAYALSSVKFPSTLETIGEGVFRGQRDLKAELELPGSLKELGDGCFGETSIVSVLIPEGIEDIPADCFRECHDLAEASLPQSLKRVGEYAFCDSGLTELVLPGGFEEFGDSAFRGCDALKKITMPVEILPKRGFFLGAENVEVLHYIKGSDGIMPDYETGSGGVEIDGVEYAENPLYYGTQPGSRQSLKQVIFEEGIVHIGDYACYMVNFNPGSLTEATLPSTLESIGDYAFCNQPGLQGLSIPEACLSIGRFCFYNDAGLTEIRLPQGMTRVQEGCFEGCTGLKELEIPESVNTIEAEAFRECAGLETLNLPEKLTALEREAFYFCSGLKEVTLPVDLSLEGIFGGVNKVERIHYLKGASGILPDRYRGGIGEPGEQDYYVTLECASCGSLKTVDFEEGITRIGNIAFWKDGELYEAVLPSTLESIGHEAFSECTALSSLELPEGLESIGGNAFAGSALAEVTLPESLSVMGGMCFYGCSSLAKVVFVGNAPSVDSDYTEVLGIMDFQDLFGGDVLQIIYDPEKGGWTQDKMDEMGEGAMVIWLRRDEPVLSLPVYLKEIGEEAFAGVASRIIEIPDGTRTIGARAFADMQAPVLIRIPSSVTNIDETAFPDERQGAYFVETPEGSKVRSFARDHWNMVVLP